MALRPGETPGHGIAVFPFLKTHGTVRLGSFIFRSTDDITGLDEEDSAHVREIADMLFLQDDLRVHSGSYAILPAIDLEKVDSSVRELEDVQAIVAYCYSAPHPTFGSTFLCFEHASLAIFSPEPVSIFMVRPEYHVDLVGPRSKLIPDQWHRVPGYQGRYNFRHPFWVIRGSRLYPPVPNIGLNISQDLASDIGQCLSEASKHRLLLELLQGARAETGVRVLRAIRWYNRANTLTSDDNEAVIHLAIAFETLLGLPKDAKTDRFVDAVSLLLGRITRLRLWAEQFYDARSDVAHEGTTGRLDFVPGGQKKVADAPLYHSLLAYGRQIFQLCVGALLFGADLGARAGLREKLTTNQERFELICKTLDDNSQSIKDRFAGIHETVALTCQFRFVPETGLLIATLIGVVQLAAKNLLLSGDTLDPAFRQRVEALAVVQRSPDFYEALTALQAVKEFKAQTEVDPQSPEGITRQLAEVIWHYTFMHYFWLKEQRGKSQNSV